MRKSICKNMMIAQSQSLFNRKRPLASMRLAIAVVALVVACSSSIAEAADTSSTKVIRNGQNSEDRLNQMEKDYPYRKKQFGTRGQRRRAKGKKFLTNDNDLALWSTMFQPDDFLLSMPTGSPSISPTKEPEAPVLTTAPTQSPIMPPTPRPTLTPGNPTTRPTTGPTQSPVATLTPTKSPVIPPTPVPTAGPIGVPTASPSSLPTNSLTRLPTGTPGNPTANPTNEPTASPSSGPTKAPTVTPGMTALPTTSPTSGLPNVPTASPTALPTESPARTPTVTPGMPTLNPTSDPTSVPTISPTSGPTDSPTRAPTGNPGMPTLSPTASFTSNPTTNPTSGPTSTPTMSPTSAPTKSPSRAPTATPGMPTVNPSTPPTPGATQNPTMVPTVTPGMPTASPSIAPSPFPTAQPSSSPTKAPSSPPTSLPTRSPAVQPTENPTVEPTSSPTDSPTSSPTSQPTIRATMLPTLSPTFASTPNNRAMRVINPVALFNGIEFEDPESYQSKALAWLESSNLDPFNDDELVQRYALASIYYATNGVVTSFTNMSLGEGVVFPWNNETNWLSDESECTWARMTCNETTGFISGIDFNGNFLTGEFPPEVVLLKGSLERLILSDNLVFTRGETFNSYMGELQQLTRLDYSNTNFINQNGIPTEIGLLKRLGNYKASRVRYVGTISSLAFPSDMTQLSLIEIELNTFRSTIPTEVGLLPSLEAFYARNSDITGDLEFMRRGSNLQEVLLGGNPDLGGTLPAFLSTLTKLISFSVSRGSFDGPLPTEIGLLAPTLRRLSLYGNGFSGPIPSEWSQLTRLEILELEENILTGLVPNGICELRLRLDLADLSADCVNCPMGGPACCHKCTDENGNVVQLS